MLAFPSKDHTSLSTEICSEVSKLKFFNTFLGAIKSWYLVHSQVIFYLVTDFKMFFFKLGMEVKILPEASVLGFLKISEVVS